MNKRSTLLFFALVLIVVGFIFVKTLGGGNRDVKPVGVVDPLMTEVEKQEGTDSGRVVEVKMTAKQWEFSPKRVRVKEGDRVKMTITSLDVDHGFAINELGVSETIPAGKTVAFEFVADKKGTYRQYCNVLCGVGHSAMAGEFIVE